MTKMVNLNTVCTRRKSFRDCRYSLASFLNGLPVADEIYHKWITRSELCLCWEIERDVGKISVQLGRIAGTFDVIYESFATIIWNFKFLCMLGVYFLFEE